MRVVRQWMIKPFKFKLSVTGGLSLFMMMFIISSCNPTEITGTNSQSNVISNNNGNLTNKAFIYRDNPTMYAGKKYGPSKPKMGDFIDTSRAEYVTDNSLLEGNCGGNYFTELSGCVKSLRNEENLQSLPRPSDQTWIFKAGSPEFYQVNGLYHIQKSVDKFIDHLEFAYDRVRSVPYTLAKSIPPYLRDSRMYWFRGVSNINSKIFRNDYLTSYSQCNIDGNAVFNPAGPDLCFGHYSIFPGFYFIQDPTVIYHEMGHALVSIMMNLRNGTSALSHHELRSNLGSFGYDEAGSINEGIADYFSFMMNKRAHMGEWALGRTARQSRPMHEDDPIHIPGVDSSSEGRLSYPQFLLYDPNNPDSPFEDVHYAGQIVSHYLVALTKSLKKKCNLTIEPDGGHNTATSYVTLLLAETLSEIGDLNAKGIDEFASPSLSSYYFTNLDKDSSFLWTHNINQTTYRRFFQIFGKNIAKYISAPSISGGICPTFSRTDSEQLLDDYGLLLFKNYNNSGKSTKDKTKFYSDAVWFITNPVLTQVVETNRRKSVLISKQLLDLAAKTDATPNAISYYIIDNRSDMEGLLKDLLYKGLTVPISTEVANIDYNNGNIKISPGEIVAVIPNLHNSSNSTMAGVQLLANDWDHVHVSDETTGNFRPCVIDTVTTVDQGGQSPTPPDVVDNAVTRLNSCNPVNGYPDVNYQRMVKNAVTNKFPANAAAPVCMVQLEEGSSTRWVSQNEFRKKQGLSLLDKDCLGYTTSGTTDTDFTFNPHECLVRFLPGANDAFFSKIDPQKNYYESVVKNSENMEFNSGNLLLLEVNRWIPPGTKFRCRLRARFSNCSDCYNDDQNANDDFMDADYNGHRPFKVINFEFDVND